MPSPSNTTLLDDFNRDPPLGSSWSTVLGSGLKSYLVTQVTAASASGDNAGALNTSTYGPTNLDFLITYSTELGASSFIELDAFADITNGSPDGYALGISTNGANSQRLYRIDNGAYTGLGSAYTSWAEAVGDRFWLSKRGSTWTAYASTDGTNWTQTCTATDSTYSGPFYPGVNISFDAVTNGAALDDLRGGTVTVSNPPPFRMRQSRLRGGDVLRGTPSASSPQTLQASSIATAEAFGSDAIKFSIAASGLGTTEAVGAGAIGLHISVVGIETFEQIGAVVFLAQQSVDPGGIVPGELFGVASIPQQQFAIVAGITSDEAIGVASVGALLSALGISTQEVFGLQLIRSALSATGIPSGESVGLSALIMSVVPTGAPPVESFGSSSVAPTFVVLSAGIGTGEVVSAASLRSWLFHSSLASDESFGTDQLNHALAMASIASSEAMGNHWTVVLSGVLAQGIASAESIGTFALLVDLTVDPAGVASSESFGSGILHRRLPITGVDSQEAMGLNVMRSVVVPTPIGASEVVGAPSVIRLILAPSFGNGSSFGNATLFPGPIVVELIGIDPTSTMGDLLVSLLRVPLAAYLTGVIGSQAMIVIVDGRGAREAGIGSETIGSQAQASACVGT